MLCWNVGAVLNQCCSKSAAALAVTLKWIPGNAFCCCEQMKIELGDQTMRKL